MNKKLSLLPISVAFLFGFANVNAQNSTKLIQDYYQKNGQLTQKSNANDKIGVVILNEDASKSLGAHIVNVQQTYNGLKVYNALGKVIIKGDQIVSEKNDFNRNVIVANQKKVQDRFSEGFLMQKLGLSKISEADYSSDVYFEKNGVYVLSKEIFVSDGNSSDVWHVIVDAGSGEVLTKDNMTLDCNFENSSDSHEKHHEKLDSPWNPQPTDIKVNAQSTTASLLLPSNASYNIFPLPIEAPTFGGRTIINNPWDLVASPEGWHSDGTNSYTNTRGNNVYAYSDQDNANTPGYSPDGGSTRNFDFPFADDRFANPFAYRDAAVTNLFYMNNKMHDIFYKFGFTETARNFQTNNFANGGIGGDAVRAEAFDGSGLNNANFSSGYERVVSGQIQVLAPRMQMYLYDRTQTADDPILRYQYNSPATIINRPKALTAGASFGPIFGPPVTGDLVISSPADACTAPAAGSLTNKIALITSTGCEYGLKVLNAENAGAIGVIVYRPAADAPVGMGAGNSGGQVSIPSINIGKAEGEFMIAQLNNGPVNVTLNFDYSGFKHSSFDNGIIAHEYGHGISNRLTGQGYSCLSTTNTTEQMGEGWSDYFALMITTRPGDTSALARGVGTYPKGQPITGVGIRPAKYSPDFSVNDYTYAKTNTAVIPHGVGFIWATMLWDLTWKYIEKYGYNSDVLASTTSGNAKALQIVIDGLKLQACSPSFIDGRDAILQADAVGNAGADKCMIWNAFAKRGLGVNASAGSKTVSNDQVEDFTVPQECNASLETKELTVADNRFVIFPNPTYDEFFVGNIDKSSKEVKIRMFDMSGKLVFTDSRESASKKAISTRGFQKGVYMVHIQQGDKTQVEKLIVR
ncbi:metalloprotease [Chryseobacterium lactis]|uniref:Metalloprotease n=1 Tax=Chryseobacterium lactis TaxID=1241981 RepID=A0A3G6RX42_CHRLC|nr:T9SS-dependent M36 family metallopeptidase [Chryseobacterium lactis]AZA81139.1 T9SS C-terminal target domain-containing protein [Chryseobacterium lactis]AZB06140.1 T9SS C-terminal target domain-containing protein [Chryseobacterium lactis]PNW14990.1 metalloprotease [Chryseobacterium lactis]